MSINLHSRLVNFNSLRTLTIHRAWSSSRKVSLAMWFLSSSNVCLTSVRHSSSSETWKHEGMKSSIRKSSESSLEHWDCKGPHPPPPVPCGERHTKPPLSTWVPLSSKMSLSITEMMKVTFLLITVFELISTIELPNVSREISLGDLETCALPQLIIFSLQFPPESFCQRRIEYQLLTGRNTVVKL